MRVILLLQPAVDTFQAAIWWQATARKAILCIASGCQLPTSSNGGNDYDFSGQNYQAKKKERLVTGRTG